MTKYSSYTFSGLYSIYLVRHLWHSWLIKIQWSNNLRLLDHCSWWYCTKLSLYAKGANQCVWLKLCSVNGWERVLAHINIRQIIF